MQSTSRIYCDAAKKSAFLKDDNLKLAEDLSADERDRRNRLSSRESKKISWRSSLGDVRW